MSSSTTSTTASSSTGASPGDSGASGAAAASADGRIRGRRHVRGLLGKRSYGRRRRRRGRRRPRDGPQVVHVAELALRFALRGDAVPPHGRGRVLGHAVSPRKQDRQVRRRARVAGLGALREISQSFLAGFARAAPPNKWRMPRSQAAILSPCFARSFSSPCATDSGWRSAHDLRA